MTRVSVVIVTYNSVRLIDRCLESVYAQASDALNIEVIVVDNASSDGTPEHIRRHHPSVRLVELSENRGFAAGNNAGFRVSTGDWWLMLNTDAFPHAGAVSELVRFMEDNPNVGICGPRLLNEDGSLQRSARAFPTLWRLATEFFYLRRLAPRSSMFNRFYQGSFSHREVADMDFLMGACLMVRPTAARQVGALDEGYFMYSEEVDWARRFHDAGWRVTYVPDAEVTHIGGGSWADQRQFLYNLQVAGHIRYLAIHRSQAYARAARVLLRAALGLRAGAYHLAGLVASGTARTARRARARSFAAARRSLGEVDPSAISPEIPQL